MRSAPTISLNGNKILDGYDPEFFNVTALDPRVTLRSDATKGRRRSSSRARVISTDYTCEGASAEERRNRTYERGWC